MTNEIDDVIPINIGLYFGDKNLYAGGANTVENFIIGLNAQMGPNNGIADKITVYLGRNNYSGTTKCAIYRASDGVFIGGTEEKTIDGWGGFWEDFLFLEPKPNLVANEIYFICAWAQAHETPGLYNSIVFADNLNTLGCSILSRVYGDWPNPIEANEWGINRTISIYCTYM